MTLHRRTLLAGAGALSWTAFASSLAFAQTVTDYPFTLGVASGDPWPDGFVIWTRLAPRPLEPGYGMAPAMFEVAYEVAADDRFRTIVRKGRAVAAPELGHSVHVELAGLEPQGRYWYRFTIGAHVSPVGTARCAPAAGSAVEDGLRIGVAGCQNYEHGFFTAYRYMAAEHLDAIFHYGDYIYEGRQGQRSEIPLVREHFGPEPTTLDLYRTRYAQYKLDPDLQAAHASAAFLTTFDDHEVDNNWAGTHDQDGSPEAAFLVRRFEAMRAWYENMPVRAAQAPRDGGVQMYRRLDYGGLMRVHLMDTRQHRDDQVCGEGAGKTCRPLDQLQQGTILGEAQHRWLEDGLDARFTWNLIAQQVVVMPFDTRAGPDDPLEISADSWAGYPASRAKLVEALKARKITNAVIATGDVHQNIIGYLPARPEEPEGEQVATEFVCTSIASLGDGQDVKIRGADFRKVIARNPNVFFANGQRGYQVFNIAPDHWRTEVMKVDKVSDTSGRLSRLAAFTVEKGSPLAIPS